MDGHDERRARRDGCAEGRAVEDVELRRGAPEAERVPERVAAHRRQAPRSPRLQPDELESGPPRELPEQPEHVAGGSGSGLDERRGVDPDPHAAALRTSFGLGIEEERDRAGGRATARRRARGRGRAPSPRVRRRRTARRRSAPSRPGTARAGAPGRRRGRRRAARRARRGSRRARSPRAAPARRPGGLLAPLDPAGDEVPVAELLRGTKQHEVLGSPGRRTAIATSSGPSRPPPVTPAPRAQRACGAGRAPRESRRVREAEGDELVASRDSLADTGRDRLDVERVDAHCRVPQASSSDGCAEATTGVPHAIASMIGMPNPSKSAG